MGGLTSAEVLASNGVGEIRTHEGLAPLAVFKTEPHRIVPIHLDLLVTFP